MQGTSEKCFNFPRKKGGRVSIKMKTLVRTANQMGATVGYQRRCQPSTCVVSYTVFDPIFPNDTTSFQTANKNLSTNKKFILIVAQLLTHYLSFTDHFASFAAYDRLSIRALVTIKIPHHELYLLILIL